MILEKIHAGFASFLERRDLIPDKHRIDGAIVMTLDRAFRIYCRPAPHGDLVFESRILQLPSSPQDEEDLIRRCLLASWVRIGTHADVPVVSDDGNYLLLHQRLPSDATVDEVEQSLEHYVNSIADWRRIFRIL